MRDPLSELVEALAATNARLADLEARHERMFRPGKVTDVDPVKQRYRHEVGIDPDGNPVKSPWVPYSQVAGGLKVHSPPSVGQQMMLISPDGDHSQAFGVPLTFSDSNPSPSQAGGVHVEQLGVVTITNDGQTASIKAGSVTFAVSADGVTINGGPLKHNDHSVGADHKHVGVRAGPDTTGTPQ